MNFNLANRHSLNQVLSAQRLSWWTFWLVLVVMAWFVSQLIWQWVTPSQSPLTAKPANAPVPLERQVALSISHLFEGDAKTSQTDDPAKLAETQLKAKLLGTFLWKDQSYALLEINGKTLSLGLEESLQPGVKISGIYDAWISLDNRGRSEKLTLLQDTQKLSLEASPAAKTSPKTAQSSAPQAGADFNYRLDQKTTQEFSQLKRQLKRDPKKIENFGKIQPYYDASGKMLGYAFSPKNAAELYQAFGLLPNDVITHINGLDLTDTLALKNEDKSFFDKTDYTFSLLRNGQSLNIQVSF